MGVAYNPTIVRDGLVLCLDAGNTKSYPGSGTTWTDLSGNGNNGTLENGVGYSGDNLGSLSFDGVDDYGSFAGSENNVSLGTIECWCKPDNPSDNLNQQIVSRTNTSAGTFNLLKNSSNKFQFNMRLSTTSQYIIESDNDATTDWTHVIGTYDGTTQKIFVNGSQQSSTTSIFGVLDTSGTLTCNIGRNTTGSAYFGGGISIIRIYNRSLSGPEIQQNYNALKSRFINT